MLKSTAVKSTIRTLDRLRRYDMLADLCARYVAPVRPDAAPDEIAGKKFNVLVMNVELFRNDIDLFDEQSDIRFYAISWGLLSQLLRAFVDLDGLDSAEKPDEGPVKLTKGHFFNNPPAGWPIADQRVSYRAFLRRFLPVLFSRLNIQAVVGADPRWRRQADFGRISSELGYPYIAFYREANLVPGFYKLAVQRNQQWGPFYTDMMAVQNQRSKQMMLDTGHFSEEEITVWGSSRMDGYLARIKQRHPPAEPTQVSLFTWLMVAPMGDGRTLELLPTMLASIRTVARTATKFPDVRFILKLKDLHLKHNKDGLSLIDQFKQEIEAATGKQQNNIEFNTDRMVAQDIILDSSIVCAMQSTVVLEAAIAGKPVVIPHFKSLLTASEADQALLFRNNHDLFDVPADEFEMEEMLCRLIENPQVSEETMAARGRLFEECVSPLDGTATRNGIELIRNAISARQQGE